jgi:hypothetical protein
VQDKPKKDRAFTAIIVLLSVIAAAALVYDMVYIMDGEFALDHGGTRHFPFLLPGVLGIFIGIMVKIQRLTRDR